MKTPIYCVLATLLLLISACSVLKQEDNEKQVRDFLLSFQNNLSKTDDIILKQFDAQQSREVLISAVKVLQNKEHEFILCEPAYGLATITMSEESIKVVIPVTFKSQNLNEKFEEFTTVTLWLKPRKKSYLIDKLEAEEFYKTFSKIRSEMEWQVERARELAFREPIYKLARSLEANFDSLVWFTRYGEKHFFYVVSGQWTNWFNQYGAKRPPVSAKMGLTDESGEVIIPMEYDLVGTIGFDFTNIAEVSKDGKFGFFDVAARKLVVPVEYDMIIPYRKKDVRCIVKSDSVYGWFDSNYVYTVGFPNPDAESWVKNFKFIPSNLHLDIESYSLSEIPNEEEAGNGIIVMPSYLVKTGVFNDIVAGISPTQFAMNGYTDYVETKASVLNTITESVSALVTTIRERYLDGREEFYTHNKLVFVGPKQDTLAVARVYSGGEVFFNTMDSLLVVKSIPDSEYYGGEMGWDDNMPSYYFFILTDDMKVEKLESRRNFPQTEFVKLDSSYLTGEFLFFDESAGKMQESNFLSHSTLTYMRNEILASYGVKFFSKEGYDEFPHFKKVETRTMEDLSGIMTENDAYNVNFLNSVIDRMQPQNAI